MAQTLSHKIIGAHLLKGDPVPGNELPFGWTKPSRRFHRYDGLFAVGY